MSNPPLGQPNLGAVAGAAVGAIGGLFAVGVAPAIIGRNPALLFSTPTLALICWFISGPVGWLVGGQIGPRLGERYNNNARIEVIGGAMGGLVPVVVIALWGWYMVTPH